MDTVKVSNDGSKVDAAEKSMEKSIIVQLRELNLVRNRRTAADHNDAYELEQVYENIGNCIIQRDGARCTKLAELLEESLTLRRLILFLRGWRPVDIAPNFYFESAMDSLIQITKLAYDAEYRKAAIVVGIVEACAELLVLEVARWKADASIRNEFVDSTGRNERREVRKQIASVLTNLTFGSAAMKRLLAEYDGFMQAVTQIIDSAPNLVLPYANLLRNVSWASACVGIAALYETAPALTRAAIDAYHKGDDNSVKSTLSAIWNLVGSGGEECVRTVAETEGCMDMLMQLLSIDAHSALVVEYSTGILKYASAELVRGEKLEHFAHLRARLIARLLPLLRASSMTIVKNALCAVNEVAVEDPTTVVMCMTASAWECLGQLQTSADDEIRRPARSILSRIGAGDYGGGMMSRSAHVGSARDMSISMRYDRPIPSRSPYCSPAITNSSCYGGAGQYTMGSSSPRYGNMEPMRAAVHQQAQQHQLMQRERHMHQLQQTPQASPLFAPPPHTTPRGFPVPASFAPPLASTPLSFAPLPFSMSAAAAVASPRGGVQSVAASGPPTIQFEQRQREGEYEYYEDEEDDELSIQMTCAGSMESLFDDGLSQDISDFHSNVDTANNSCRLSPVSYSDLPDSPSKCAAIRDMENTQQLHFPSFPSFLGTVPPPIGVGPSSSAGGSSGTSHTTPHATSAEQTPTYFTLNRGQ